ncbi:unnamed protein product [Aureobasidium vineae]|uniref:Zn(2)-C6 fungal-type domain-containing protein n=1 Tax=Aureobasidium vineae TaxID=2773715 RepID=A0A9N8P5C3_9PEZI|nr:unnamed protein product [Aureobasidium vineae]
MNTASVRPSAAPQSPAAVPLSCTLCRKRKIKCDKQNPCSNCATSQKECIPVVRARLPRGRNGGRKGINSELRNRINRLEGLVQSLNSGLLPDNPDLDSLPQKTRTNSETQTSTSSGPFTFKQQPFDSREATPDTTRWPLGSTLWTQLAHELNDIHTVLDNEDDDNDNDDDIDSSPPSVPTDSSGTPGDLLFTSQPVTVPIPVVSNSDVLEYIKIFRRNVDYILKFVHLPSFEKLLTEKEPYLGHAPESPAIQALMASAFYACICSISNSHCLIAFNKKREDLRNEWQQATFQCLSQVEIVKRPSLSEWLNLYNFIGRKPITNCLGAKLKYVVAYGEAEKPPTPIQSSWKVRQDAIARLERTFEEDILSHIQEDGVFRFASISFTKVLLRCAQLYAVRPLQRHPQLTLPPPEHMNILLLAVEALEVKRGLLSETTEPWHWIIKGFVDWHGLAVLLAELCNPDQYDAQLLERAWTVGLLSFDELSGQIAEGTQGPLWRPIKKLMRVAQKKRQERSTVAPTMVIPGPSDNYVDDLSAYTTSTMDLMPMNAVMDVGQGWNTISSDPLQASWFNWQSFTDDVASLNNGYSWGAMDFDPIFEGL